MIKSGILALTANFALGAFPNEAISEPSVSASVDARLEVSESFISSHSVFPSIMSKLSELETRKLHNVAAIMSTRECLPFISRLRGLEPYLETDEEAIKDFVWNNRSELFPALSADQSPEHMLSQIMEVGEAYLTFIGISPVLKYLGKEMRDHIASSVRPGESPINKSLPKFELTQTFDFEELAIIAKSGSAILSADKIFMVVQLPQGKLYIHGNTGASILFKETDFEWYPALRIIYFNRVREDWFRLFISSPRGSDRIAYNAPFEYKLKADTEHEIIQFTFPDYETSHYWISIANREGQRYLQQMSPEESLSGTFAPWTDFYSK